jgi:hypothetical protein
MDKPNVPRTPVDPKMKILRFDLRGMVRRWMEAKLAVAYLRKKRYEEAAAFFEGIATGYTDWFKVLNVSQEKINAAQLTFNPAAVEGKVMKMVDGITAAVVDRRRIIVPGQNISEQDVSYLKKLFGLNLNL